MNVNGKTRIAGIFGYPIEHTLSPLMHNSAFRALDLDMCYVPFSVHPDYLKDAVRAIRSLNLIGVNITIPHKEKVIPLLDRVDREASFMGAVNTVTNDKGILTGYNTDGRGFISSLGENSISIDNKTVFIIGAGGASRAISYYICQKAANLILYDIDKDKAGQLASDLKKIRENVRLADDVRSLDNVDILINATPLGLKPSDPLPLDPEIITSNMVVCDLVYKKTPLQQEAEKRNAMTINGSGMLLWQGVLAFELWTGIKPPVEVMRDVLLSNLS